ncbi:HdeD family acid-resistance protein [Rhizobium cauense]|uniref:HdeD family acid-resistance protein n=1 Tax=Rhizobium cauense TaxID=1166683 RepID=UPI001CB78E7C|nr:HdeD family acid-resistance protein [Rhizobium cauense]
MSSISAPRTGLSTAHVEKQWGWFAALGVGMLIAGGIASANLFASTLASVFYIAAMMLLGAVMQIVHAFTSRDWKRRALYLLTGIFYGAAGGLAVYDPVFSALGITIGIGALLVASGVFRGISGLLDRTRRGWGWIAASGCLTFFVGAFILSQPLVGLWFLGGLLTVDLIFQGWGFIAFGLALRARRRASRGAPSHA